MVRAKSYKEAGVDLDIAQEFKRAIADHLKRTFDPNVIEKLGGFGGFYEFQPRSVINRKYKHPVLVAATDGVGTKLKVAVMMDKHDTVGIDLVAMNANDIACHGASPLFFLDYIAVGKLDRNRELQIIKGIADGCVEAECALLGGETAQMPGVYREDEYDLAGFIVGIVERAKVIDGNRIKPGDALIGLASNGLHSNGFSLVRRVFFERAKCKVTDRFNDLDCTLGEELLKPTRIYVKAVKGVLKRYRVKNIIRGIAHITGGGIVENLERILPPNCCAEVKKGSWDVPPVFRIVKRLGRINEREMYRVFNMGIGMIFVVPPYFANSVVKQLHRLKQRAFIIGEIKRGERQVKIVK